MSTTWDLLTSPLPELLRPMMLFLSRCTEASHPTHHFPPLIWLLGWVPQAPTALDFRMSPKHSCGKITVGTNSCCFLCYAKMKMQPAATHVCRVLGDTDISHKHILHLIFGVFNLFACTFILIMQHPSLWLGEPELPVLVCHSTHHHSLCDTFGFTQS